MSSSKMGADCCGDRYACNSTKKCPCGCGLFYCQSCYGQHCIEIVEAGGKTRGRPKEEVE
jgi:hypothetical protein